jgi:hypothetical protein
MYGHLIRIFGTVMTCIETIEIRESVVGYWERAINNESLIGPLMLYILQPYAFPSPALWKSSRSQFSVLNARE